MPAASPERSDELDAELDAALLATQLAGWYYPLCARFPLRTASDYRPQGDAMRAAWRATGLTVKPLTKRVVGATIGDRVRRLQVLHSPSRLGGDLEIVLHLFDTGRAGIATAHNRALAHTDAAGGPRPDPPYPRPWVVTDAELDDLVGATAAYVRDLATVLGIAS